MNATPRTNTRRSPRPPATERLHPIRFDEPAADRGVLPKNLHKLGLCLARQLQAGKAYTITIFMSNYVDGEPIWIVKEDGKVENQR